MARKLIIKYCAMSVGIMLTMQPLAWAQEPSSLQFQNSCSDAVQFQFNNAIALLHSFEYPETTRLFREISKQDAGCAMARWGSAMSIWHPLWAPPSKADLEAGARLLAETEGLDMTPREAAYINALKAFFSSADRSTHLQRARAFEAKMGEVYVNYLDDPESTVFYSLALLAAADPRDKSYARQYKSASLLNWVRSSHPEHPGVLHYLIHSYDFPGLAHLALDSAMIYADVAPNSAHAQHMPSHIFTRLGLWERSLSSNHDSTRSAAEYTQRAHLSGHYDEGLHGMDYLMYAMLQTARDDEARELLNRLAGITRTDTENFKVAYTYAASPARFVLERRAWKEASELEFIRKDFGWDEFPWAQSIHYFARGIGSVRNGDVNKANQELAVIRELQSRLSPNAIPYWREEMQVQVDALTAWIALANGDDENALRLASAAADREDLVDKHPVTPGEVLPARELYAEMLLETGNYLESLSQYQVVLSGSPNRLNAMLGAARAAKEAGNLELAVKFGDIVREQTRNRAPGRDTPQDAGSRARLESVERR